MALDWAGRMVAAAGKRRPAPTAAVAAAGGRDGALALLRGRTQNFLDGGLVGVTSDAFVVVTVLRSGRVVVGSTAPLFLLAPQPGCRAWRRRGRSVGEVTSERPFWCRRCAGGAGGAGG